MPLAATLAKSAFQAVKSHEKPHSSTTDWIEILTSEKYNIDDYDGIPELVDSINLQAGGITEASRAIRKKLKHGNVHRQLRALTILRALVENSGQKFQTTFADDRLVDALRSLASEPGTDPKVKKKLQALLASWHRQFKDDPSMKTVANLYKSAKADQSYDTALLNGLMLQDHNAIKAIERDREEKKRKIREAKELVATQKKDREEAKRKERERANRPRRPPFNFEQEKPAILTAIANASQASNNFVNAITLVNTQQESLQDNERVQDCLTKLKAARKPIVRYVQLVENEELIGTLLETNERVISALEIYDMALHQPGETAEPATDPQPLEPSTTGGSSVQGELSKLQLRQRLEIQRSASNRDVNSRVHPDLRGLNFGEDDDDEDHLPPPIRPSGPDSPVEEDYARGTLSDYSDYDSEDGRRPPPSDSSDDGPGPSRPTGRRASAPAGGHTAAKQAYADLLGDEEDTAGPSEAKRGLLREEEDPFADPFADCAATSKAW